MYHENRLEFSQFDFTAKKYSICYCPEIWSNLQDGIYRCRKKKRINEFRMKRNFLSLSKKIWNENKSWMKFYSNWFQLSFNVLPFHRSFSHITIRCWWFIKSTVESLEAQSINYAIMNKYSDSLIAVSETGFSFLNHSL